MGTLDGHTDPVYAIAWSPDGKTLATAGFDNTVRLWDAATRKEIKKYEGHTKLVLAVAIAPDGKHILSGSQDNTAKIWDFPTSGPAKTFAGHPAAARGPGRQARRQAVRRGSGQVGQGLGLDDRGSRQGPARDTPATWPSASWRGDGGQLATGDKAHTIRLWKGDLTPEAAIETPADGVLGLAYLPNNQQLVSAGSDGLARLWQLPVAAPRRFETKGPVAAFALSRDGTKLATAGADKVVRIWNPGRRQTDQGDPSRRARRRRRVSARWLANRRRPRQQVRADLRRRRRQRNQENRRARRHRSPRWPFEATAASSPSPVRTTSIRVINAADGKTVKELKGHAGRDPRAGVFAQGWQPDRLGLGRQDRQALGRQPGQIHPRFQRPWRCGAGRERQPRRHQTRHGLGRQDGPGLEPGRRQDACDSERARRPGHVGLSRR